MDEKVLTILTESAYQRTGFGEPGKPATHRISEFANTVRMPSKAKLLAQIKDKTKVLGVSEKLDKFIALYVDRVADREITANFAVSAWITARLESFEANDILSTTADWQFPKVIRAMVADKTFVGQAEDVLKEAVEAASKKDGTSGTGSGYAPVV